MRRLWNAFAFILMVVAAVLAGFMATDQTLAAQAKTMPPLGNGLIMALAGLIGGVILAWCWRVNWRAMPMRFRYWLVLQRKRLWWTTTALASIGILVFY